ncbi:hypothetical protein [Sinomicrobium weinanense]|uniref:Uncharacterized protein n=1 Tax=Sinomicrobium weinanense TaxID=2842200 RepID=A0A926JSK6_9FLAO|nr:hypothetical protein [Sinomicrobium weinanense]MBC9796745.1 hypothetical protein [Sinomicrobium weinanense]MBU3124016.1 hypothetical protein [Sinomicrobium weinanense]
MEKYSPQLIDALAKEFKTTPQSIVYCLNNQDIFPFFASELRLECNYLQRKWKI